MDILFSMQSCFWPSHFADSPCRFRSVNCACHCFCQLLPLLTLRKREHPLLSGLRAGKARHACPGLFLFEASLCHMRLRCSFHTYPASPVHLTSRYSLKHMGLLDAPPALVYPAAFVTILIPESSQAKVRCVKVSIREHYLSAPEHAWTLGFLHLRLTPEVVRTTRNNV